jgi:hypothetical protein
MQCQRYEGFRTARDTHYESMNYFLSDAEKPGVSPQRATQLAKEEEQAMMRASDAMLAHRQLCRCCMAEDRAQQLSTQGY